MGLISLFSQMVKPEQIPCPSLRKKRKRESRNFRLPHLKEIRVGKKRTTVRVETGVILGVGAFSATDRVHKSFRIGYFTNEFGWQLKKKGQIFFFFLEI